METLTVGTSRVSSNSAILPSVVTCTDSLVYIVLLPPVLLLLGTDALGDASFPKTLHESALEEYPISTTILQCPHTLLSFHWEHYTFLFGGVRAYYPIFPFTFVFCYFLVLDDCYSLLLFILKCFIWVSLFIFCLYHFISILQPRCDLEIMKC